MTNERVKEELNWTQFTDNNIKFIVFHFFSGASSSIDAVSANLSSLKLGVPDHDRSPQLVKLLDENLQWNDSALEVGQ